MPEVIDIEALLEKWKAEEAQKSQEEPEVEKTEEEEPQVEPEVEKTVEVEPQVEPEVEEVAEVEEPQVEPEVEEAEEEPQAEPEVEEVAEEEPQAEPEVEEAEEDIWAEPETEEAEEDIWAEPETEETEEKPENDEVTSETSDSNVQEPVKPEVKPKDEPDVGSFISFRRPPMNPVKPTPKEKKDEEHGEEFAYSKVEYSSDRVDVLSKTNHVEDGIEEDFAYIKAESENPIKEKQPSNAAEGENLRPLTREEKELYAPFIQSKAGREQLIKALDDISMASYTGNLIITGESGVDTLGLAKSILREIQQSDSNFSGKVAKIDGDSLNRKDVAQVVQSLRNGAIIIANAPEMSDETAGLLDKALQKENTGIIAIMEGTKRSINRFLSSHQSLAGCFTCRIDVEPLSNDTLVEFGRQYAREREFSIDDFGILALHTRVEELQTSDHMVTVDEVKEIVDEAIERSTKKSFAHLMDVVLKKRYDTEDMIVLGEKDFTK